MALEPKGAGPKGPDAEGLIVEVNRRTAKVQPLPAALTEDPAGAEAGPDPSAVESGRLAALPEDGGAGHALPAAEESGRREDRVPDEIVCQYSPMIDLKTFGNFAVGDRVLFRIEPDGMGLITAVLPRKNRLSRPGPVDRAHQELVLAANVDLLLVVMAVKAPDFNARLLDRYLVVAERFGLPCLIALNKSDLSPETPPEMPHLASLGYDYHHVSAETGLGLPALRERLSGKAAVLSGPSGAGKSSLVKALSPGLELRIGEVREKDGKGRHTTTASHLYRLEGEGLAPGTCLIDTPGIRELGLWQVTPEELLGYFPDLKAFDGRCRFRDCKHQKEPSCSLRAAIASGEVPENRYDSYLRMLESLG